MKLIASHLARPAAALAACGALLAVASGCGAPKQPDAEAKLRVVAAFYPLQEAAERIGGSRVAVTDLTPIGGEPHDLDPPPSAIRALGRAKLVLYLGDGFQPAVTKSVASLPASVTKLDLLSGLTLRPAVKGISGARGTADGGTGQALHGGQDPHVWVDPGRFITMAQQVQAALIAADPRGRTAYEQRGKAYIDSLRALDAAFTAGLSACKTKVIVTSHAAFGYLADRFGLTQAVIAGISPGATPDPSGKTNAPDPVEGLTADELKAGDSYASIMGENLDRLERGLRCTPSGA